jgi:uncharacterized protein (TIGR03089 family)
MPRVTDAWTLLQGRRRSAPGEPLVTHVEGVGGGRTELSSTSVENAAAKIANALRDEFELEPGDVVGLYLPIHWQRTAWLAGAWTAGCVVAPDADPGDVDLVVASTERAAGLVARARREVAVVSLHPFGLPVAEPLAAGTSDVTLAVRQQPDAYLFEPPGPALEAWRSDSGSLTQAEVLSLAGERARTWGLATGGRLLADEGAEYLDGWLAALAVPLTAGASVVLADRVADVDRLCAVERVTARVPARRS